MSLDPKRWKGSCSARCADTGRRCALPRHAGEEHADGRHRFTRVAEPGQTYFPVTAELAERAFLRAEPVIPEGVSNYRRDPDLMRATRARYNAKKAAAASAEPSDG